MLINIFLQYLISDLFILILATGTFFLVNSSANPLTYSQKKITESISGNSKQMTVPVPFFVGWVFDLVEILGAAMLLRPDKMRAEKVSYSARMSTGGELLLLPGAVTLPKRFASVLVTMH
jgi:hypothetical protein